MPATSWYEGFPFPVLEAMSCGAAIVTTNHGTEDYALNEHNALVVPPKCPAELPVRSSGFLMTRPFAER